MITGIFLSGLLVMTFVMVISKRITGLIASFRIQSFFLFLLTLHLALSQQHLELYIVSGLLFLLKVVLVPRFLSGIAAKIKAHENLGFFVKPQASLLISLVLVYSAYIFTGMIMPAQQAYPFTVSLSVTMVGMFIMIFRMKALAQVIGLMAMENGLFLAAATVSGGMPFFVEIAIFFDIFVCVIISGIFVYRINKLFTHIDVSKLRELKG